MSSKVLIITYYWPPSGGAGVQRWVKFARYLPEYGWEPYILTVDPRYAAYPVTDDSLCSEVPASVKIYHTRAKDYFTIFGKDKSKIPSAGFARHKDESIKGKMLRFFRGNFFIPDPRKGWNRYAFKKACELITKFNIENVITTSPPHSTQLIGLKLRKAFPTVNWVADLRDPWTDIYYYKQFYHTSLAKRIDSFYEKEVLRNADKIITVGESLKKLFSSKVEGTADKIEVITNGYDEEDFALPHPPEPGNFTITYVGTLSDAYPLHGLTDALSSIKDTKFILRFIGAVSPRQKEFILNSPVSENAEFIHYVDHAAAIRYMRESSALLLIIPDHESNKAILTGKLFEYIAAGRPVICLGPEDGDAAGILKETAAGSCFRYDDINDMGEYLRELVHARTRSVETARTKFSRRRLTGKLAVILDGLTTPAP